MLKVNDIVDGHRVCLRSLVGSHNYNLNTANSDKDYKYFVYPTFDDLYSNKIYHKEVVTEQEDFTIHDIRQLPELLWKSNLNFIEILYSLELDSSDGISEYLYDNRDSLSTMNLGKMWSASVGMFNQKRKDMMRDSPGRHKSFEKYGFDTKSANHALRIADFLSRVNESKNIGRSLFYDQDDPMRKLLLDVKNGVLTINEINNLLDIAKSAVESMKSDFYNYPIDELSYIKLREFIKTRIKDELIYSI